MENGQEVVFLDIAIAVENIENLSLAKPREAGWSKYGFVKVIEARGCYPTPLDFYFLNSPMEYQVDHIDEYIEARNQAKLPHVKALDMMYEAYQQSLEHGRY